MGENNDNGNIAVEHWHLDKKVPLTLIFMMIVQISIAVWAIADIKKDIEVLKAYVQFQADRDSRQDRVASESLQLLREDIKDIKSLLMRSAEQPGMAGNKK